MKKMSLIPLKIGIILAVLAGLLTTAQTLISQHYLSYHLYYTSARILAIGIDRWGAVFIAVGYLVFLAILRGKPVGTTTRLRGSAAGRTVLRFSFWTCFIFLLGVNVCAGVLHVSNSLSLRDKPNVVWIIIDTLRADQVGCYGCKRDTTPNIDRLAGQGIRFSDAVAQAPWTRPSICSFMTSRYPEELNLGKQHPPVRLADRFLTLAEMLRDKGYTTSAVVSNTNLDATVNFDQGYDYFDDSNRENELSITSPGVFSSGIEQLDKLNGKRFFLTLHFMDCHARYILHPKYNFMPDYKGKCPKVIKMNGWDRLIGCKPADTGYVLSVYDSEVKYTDEYVGAVINELKKRGLYDNTVIVLVSDHGEEFLDHGHYSHGHSLYRELLDAACIVRLPHQKTGRVVKGPFPLIDLLPSVMKYMNYDTSAYGLQGDAVDLGGIKAVADRNVFSSQDGLGVGFKPIDLRSVQLGRYKLIKSYLDGREMLFDLATDPLEKKNVLKSEPDVYAALSKALAEQRRRMDAARLSAPVPETVSNLSEKETQRLRSLGYAQ